MNGLKSETVRQRKTIYQLEKEREKYGIEASEQRSLYVQSMEEVKLRDMRINELQKNKEEDMMQTMAFGEPEDNNNLAFPSEKDTSIRIRGTSSKS